MKVRDDELTESGAEPPRSSAAEPRSVSISVVVSGHNRGRDVATAIDRVLAQRFPASEILVVDDGSTDDTIARVARHREHIRLVRQHRLGRVAAHNRGAELSTGDWVAFVDFGAPWREDHLERMAAAIAATDGAADLYFGDGERASAEGGGTHWQAARFDIETPFELVGDAARWALMRHQPMNLAAAVFCRQRFVEVGGFDFGAK
ncbi:MAG: glycosyltransferase family 2 protein, partial [Planctomycetes bacterium]|nr:glycosyltransferase family 2 protein [Planctomycetota bacterium]